jgi:hypothetical protein
MLTLAIDRAARRARMSRHRIIRSACRREEGEDIVEVVVALLFKESRFRFHHNFKCRSVVQIGQGILLLCFHCVI